MNGFANIQRRPHPVTGVLMYVMQQPPAPWVWQGTASSWDEAEGWTDGIRRNEEMDGFLVPMLYVVQVATGKPLRKDTWVRDAEGFWFPHHVKL